MQVLKGGRYTYRYQDVLGTGSFGSVYKCTDTQTKETLAIKVVSKMKLEQYGDYLTLALQREIETQKLATQTKVPFFVGLYDNFEDDKHIYIVLEFCEKSLMDYLMKAKLTEIQCLELIFQIAIGLNFLHSMHITHRDIKPENILMKKGILKIADFGFASNSSKLMTYLGTAPYMSPELFLDGDEAYTHKVDVWALNTCFYKLLTGKLYFWSPNKRALEKQVLEKEFIIPPQFNISPKVQELLIGGYQKDPSKRLSMQEYVLHPAFAQFHQKYRRFLNPLGNDQQTVDNTPQPQNQVMQSQTQNYIGKIFDELLHFRNNALQSSFFAEFLVTYGYNKVIAFYLLKLTMQKLSGIVLSFKNNLSPTFSPFDKLNFEQKNWTNFIGSNQGKTLIALYIKDLSYLSKRYSELYKTIEMAVNDGDQGFRQGNLNQLFDLNTKIDNQAVLQYIMKILENLNNFQMSMNDKKTLGDYCKNFIDLNFKNPQLQRSKFNQYNQLVIFNIF